MNRNVLKFYEKCIKWRLITRTKRLTDSGKAELKAARGMVKLEKIELPDRGEDYYYPKQLRSTARG